MAEFIKKAIQILCCNTFKSSCCELESQIDPDGHKTTHTEGPRMEFTNASSSWYLECGNTHCCLCKLKKESSNPIKTPLNQPTLTLANVINT